MSRNKPKPPHSHFNFFPAPPLPPPLPKNEIAKPESLGRTEQVETGRVTNTNLTNKRYNHCPTFTSGREDIQHRAVKQNLGFEKTSTNQHLLPWSSQQHSLPPNQKPNPILPPVLPDLSHYRPPHPHPVRSTIPPNPRSIPQPNPRKPIIVIINLSCPTSNENPQSSQGDK